MDERHARLTAAAPAPLAEKLRGVRVSGERKPVTAVFADVVGSTSLAESMDPEDWTAIMNEAYERMSEAIYRYEGTIAQLQGDALVAFFGAPIAHEDDPERAVRAALEMVAAVDELAPELHRAWGIEIRIRCGINTGRVVVGNVGSDLRYEYTAMGDAVNIAARLQSSGRPGSVTIAEATYRLVGPIFETRDLGPQAVKGKSEPVRAYEVIGPSAAGDVHRRGVPGLESPFIGRSAELELLTEAYKVVGAGRGRVVVVLGEAGVGKSRLLATFRSLAAQTAPPPTWMEAHCLSYGQRLPYHLLVGMVHAMLGINQLTPPAAARRALRASVGELLGGEAKEVGAFLEHLLGLPPESAATTGDGMADGDGKADGDGDGLPAVDAMILLDRYVASILRVLMASASRGPLVLHCEDLHWADAASVDALDRLLPMLGSGPVMFVATARPDRDVPGWQLVTAARERYGDALAEIRLGGLTDDESRQLVGNLLAIESLPASVRGMILSRGAGNPFFIEEVIRTLVEQRAVVRRGDRWVADPTITSVQLPETLEGLLQARIDRLPAEARQVMRLASVFIRAFAVDRLQQLADAVGYEVAVRDQLDLLEGSGIIEVAATDPALSYTFRHALLQEAAYESILKQERRQLHGALAELIERHETDRRQELTAVLAEHFDRAGDVQRALPYVLEAGRSALARFANQEARAFFERAEQLIEAGAVPEDGELDRLRVEIELGKVSAGWTFKPIDGELVSLGRTLEAAERLRDKRLLAEVHYWIAFMRRLRGERYDTGPELQRSLDTALALSRQIGDEAPTGLSLALMGEVTMMAGRFRAATEMLDDALPLLERRGDSRGASRVAMTLGIVYAWLGEIDRARAALGRLHELAQGADPIARLEAKLTTAFLESMIGNIPGSIAAARDCVGEAMELGHTICAVQANFMVGYGQLQLGHPELATPALEQSIELARSADVLSFRHLSTAVLAAIRAGTGALTEADSLWEEALSGARALADRMGEAQIRLVRGATLARLSGGDPGRAVADLEAAEAMFDELEARPFLAQALHARAQVLQGLGRTDEAAPLLQRADELLTAMGLAQPAAS